MILIIGAVAGVVSCDSPARQATKLDVLQKASRPRVACRPATRGRRWRKLGIKEGHGRIPGAPKEFADELEPDYLTA